MTTRTVTITCCNEPSGCATGFVAPAGPAIAVTVCRGALMAAAGAAPFSVKLVPLKPKPMASRWDR